MSETDQTSSHSARPSRRVSHTMLLLLVGALVMALVALGAYRAGMNSPRRDTGSTSSGYTGEVVRAVKTERQVVLLSLGVQGISERRSKGKILGLDIPGSERALFLQYTFTAKLGIEGKNLQITRAGDHEYVLNVPEFIFIGHDNEEFKLVAEDNGVLSFITPEADPVQMINAILNDDTKGQYVSTNLELLKWQTQNYYEGIIRGIDPDAKVTILYTS